jgi:NADH:ubiquinone reductase (non-electrogenic)
MDMSGIQGVVSDFKLDYDILITAVGADNNTFNVPGAIENCYFLKEMEDAKRIRDAIIDLVESACYPGQPIDELNRLLHFVVVGGGPTGVEFASELRDFLREDIPKIYDDLIKEHFKVTLIQSGDHILNTYDQQISKFTERNFKKTDNNVDVMTSTRVISVDADKITLRDKSTKEVWSVPYGMCVWSTGVAPRKLTQTMMANIQNETKGRALLTDGYLRVIGSDGIFALGDCSTIQQTKMIAQAEELFESADVNKDGKLCLDEFKALMEEAKYKCPQVQTFLSCAQKNVEKLFAEHDVSGDQRLDINEFKHVLATLDKQLKSLPATAQVASQQGEYLGELLSKTNGNELLTESEDVLDSRGLHKFKYRHLGSFAYVGDNQAVLEIPIFG